MHLISTSRTMNGAVDSPTACKCRVGGIDYSVHLLLRDVTNNCFDPHGYSTMHRQQYSKNSGLPTSGVPLWFAADSKRDIERHFASTAAALAQIECLFIG
jgi:hypothetical protein